MQWIDRAIEYLKTARIYANTMDWSDILEIFIIAFLVYYILAWMKTTRSWRLLKGVIVIFLFLFAVNLMEMTTIIWISENVLSFAVIGIIVVMQPELRHALEQLGNKNFMPFFSDSSKGVNNAFSEKTVNEITKACAEMAKVKTGALIVIEKRESLKDYERTGIEVDGVVTSQLLINIFEHNTPLHDGAVIVRGNRITYATCYLPLTDNLRLSKELGTRHRAGVGISEVADSLTVIVSEETGGISTAYEGELKRNLSAEGLKETIRQIMNMNGEENAKGRKRRKNKKSKGGEKGREKTAE